MRKSLDIRKSTWGELRFLLVIGMLALLGGCGASTKTVTPPVVGGSTNVVVLLTSTANDKLVEYSLAITSVTLRDSSSNTVTLFSDPSRNGPLGVTEFMHLNGTSEPLVTSSVPQGTYTSATVKVSGCDFGKATVVNGGLVESFFAEGLCGQGTGNTTVNLSSPIVISGTAMALTFDLQVSQSYTLAADNTYTISPVFNLTPLLISPSPTNDGNGKISGLNAQVASVDRSNNSFVAQTSDGISSTLTSTSNTVYQGVGGLTNLAPGTVINLDSTIQPNGSLLAMRVVVQNAASVVTNFAQPLAPASPAGTAIAHNYDCFEQPGLFACGAFQTVSSTVFHVSGQFGNLQGLPFIPNFSSSSFVLGQNMSISSTTGQTGPGGLVAMDITLEPQTINGTVTAVTNAGGFSIYRVTFAPYHIIPTAQQLPALGGFSAVTNPTTLTVYADVNTQLLQSGGVAPGSLLRFRGLVFNDNGTLRMDCQKVLDGVAQ